MPSELNLEEAGIPELIEGIGGLLFAPVVISTAAAINQPLVKAAIKQGIALSERSKEAIAEVEEVLEDLAAEAKEEIAKERRGEFSPKTARNSWVRAGESEAAIEILNVISTLNEQVGRATNGIADLRLLLPLGLGALALRQLLIKGLQIDEIPWYTLAWYALDTFTKYNHTDAPPALYPVSDSHTIQTATDGGIPESK